MVGMVGATIVPRADGRMMVGATRIDGDPSRHVTAGAVARMLAAAATLVPALAEARFGAAWAGLRPWTPDGAPVIGPDGTVDGLYWASGHSGMGILSAPTTADCLAALLDGRAPPVPLEAFDPGRFAAVAAA
jgi:glycine oxidase